MKHKNEDTMTQGELCNKLLDVAIEEMGHETIDHIATVLVSWMIDKQEGGLQVAGICAHAIKRLHKQTTANN